MASYGFRLFTVTLARGTGHKDQEWTAPGKHYADLAADLLNKDLCLDPLLLPAEPTPSQVPEHEKPTQLPQLSVGDDIVQWLDGSQAVRRVSMRFSHGKVGGYDWARTITSKQDLRQMATMRDFRAELLLPEVKGFGVLAVETIGRTCPVASVTRWLSVASRMRDPHGTWWRLRADPLVDGARLRELISNTKTASVTVVKTVDSGSGKRKYVEATLSAPLVDSSQRADMTTLLGQLLGKEKEPDPHDLLEIVKLKDVGIKFDDGWVNLSDGQSSPIRVGIHDPNEIFLYRISDLVPPPAKWDAEVLARVRSVVPSLKWD